jgi:hypothetical protein
MKKGTPMKSFFVAATVTALALAGKAQSHEFWIDPVAFEVAPGEAAVAHLRVGTEFEGSTQSYLPRNFERFDIVSGARVIPVDGRLGDIPALDMPDMPEGLAVVVHQTTERELTWSEWERFVGFVDHKDLGPIAEMQAARGLDQVDVREGYTRFAKSLIAVGDGAGADRRVGLRTEIVALANPYTDDVSGGLPVQVWLDDAPRADVRVELFDRAPDGSVTITLHRTDADGIALLPVEPGHVYQADTVTLEPVDPEAEGDPEWSTLWANMTFAVR